MRAEPKLRGKLSAVHLDDAEFMFGEAAKQKPGHVDRAQAGNEEVQKSTIGMRTLVARLYMHSARYHWARGKTEQHE
jgi:hypothetical protein